MDPASGRRGRRGGHRPTRKAKVKSRHPADEQTSGRSDVDVSHRSHRSKRKSSSRRRGDESVCNPIGYIILCMAAYLSAATFDYFMSNLPAGMEEQASSIPRSILAPPDEKAEHFFDRYMA